MPSVPGNRNFKTRTDVERDSEWEDAPGAKKKKTNEGKTLQYIGIAPDVSKKNAIVEGGSSLLDKSVSEQDKIVDCETSSNIQLQLVLKIKRSEEGTSLKVVERKRKPLQKADEKVSHDQSKTEEKNKNGIKVESVSNEVLDVSNKTKNVTFHSGIENTAYKQRNIKLPEDVPQTGLPDEKDKFPVPSWAVKPPDGAHLDVYMGTALIQKLMIDDKKAYYFGRNNKQVDIVVEHATCSRVHSLFLYSGLLKRFALVDLESSHGTFIGNVRLRPLEVVFIDIGSQFQLGASTRKYAVRLKVEQHVEEDPTVSTSDYQLDEIEKDKEPMLFSFNNIMSNTTKGDIKSGRKLRSEEDPQKDSVDLKNSLFSDEEAGPEQHVEEDPTVLASDYQLDHLTEYNTAQNRRIPQLPISLEEARRKKRKRGNIAFIDEEEVINPEDVDPSVGRFQNRVTTEIISTNSGKRAGADIKGHTPRKIVRPSREVLTAPLSSTLGSLSLNAAPTLPEKEKLEGHHKKKYAKEAWPGKKPVFYFF